MKRAYNSESRVAQAAQTKNRILEAAKRLFQAEGFDCVTIEKLAKQADVSAPTIYALFQSKLGIVRALMDEALPTDQREALVLKFVQEQSGEERLKISAKIARQMYDAERAQIDIFRGASVLAPEFKDLEKEREERRYKRQEEGVKVMAKEKILAQGMSATKARDILWAFTGRDMYRMFVVQRGWSSDEYEQWLAEILIKTLLEPAQE
ncbi:TetR/AcrR family transcriptional regulator [Candidatus Dependentiae bacterium]|jgi:AcrR family transcriptional regulator|nr:TetR/AcrR family transcriptional regulator [Candidatus Dependentiae bacterium]